MTKRNLLNLIRLAAWVCLGLSASFGVMGLLGWFAGIEALVRLMPEHSPIQPAPALLLIMVSSSAMIYGKYRRNLASAAGSLLVMTVAFAEISDFLGLSTFGLFTKLHLLLMQRSDLSPARTPANTAIALFTASIGILALNLPKVKLSIRQFLAAIGGTISGAMGTITVAAYATGDTMIYRWQGSADVALFAAAGCLFCGAGILLMLWMEREAATLPSWMPIPVSVGFLIEFLLLWTSLNQHATAGFKPPTLALGLGIVVSLLSGIAVHLARSNFERRLDQEQINNSLEAEIAQRRLAEEKFRQQQSQTAYLARLKALGEMAGGVAHEINNPLMIISGRAFHLKRIAERGAVEEKEIIAACDKIESTITRIARIVENLRLFSGENSAQVTRKAATVQGVIEDVLSLCHEKIKSEGIELIVADKLPENCGINGDSVKICQALLNLLTNSMRAVAGLQDKWIRISTDMGAPKGDLPPRIGEPSRTPERAMVVIRVTDCGGGISPDIAGQIFQPFFTTHDVGSGAGLGLSVSRGIIESMGGTIELDATSANTSFVITLPAMTTEPNHNTNLPHSA